MLYIKNYIWFFEYFRVKESTKDPTSQIQLEVQSIEHVKLAAMVNEMGIDSSDKTNSKNLDETATRKRKGGFFMIFVTSETL